MVVHAACAPRLQGPKGQPHEMLRCTQTLQPVLAGAVIQESQNWIQRNCAGGETGMILMMMTTAVKLAPTIQRKSRRNKKGTPRVVTTRLAIVR